MVETKIRLSLLVPGAKMLSSQECEENPTDNYAITRIRVKVKPKGNKEEVLVVRTRKTELITQVICICKESYDFMLETPPSEKFSKKLWKQYPKSKKLKEHFDLIAQDFNAVSYSYEILDD